MVLVRIEDRPAFRVVGRKTWIGGTDDSQFGRFWQKCREEGVLDRLARIGEQPGRQTGGDYIGVSCVENDPSNRDFHFLVSVECEAGGEGLEEYTVPAGRWAVFRNSGDMPAALVEAEMHAFLQWLPASGLRHAHAPEMEVYPPYSGEGPAPVEFWLPVEAPEPATP